MAYLIDNNSNYWYVTRNSTTKIDELPEIEHYNIDSLAKDAYVIQADLQSQCIYYLQLNATTKYYKVYQAMPDEVVTCRPNIPINYQIIRTPKSVLLRKKNTIYRIRTDIVRLERVCTIINSKMLDTGDMLFKTTKGKYFINDIELHLPIELVEF